MFVSPILRQAGKQVMDGFLAAMAWVIMESLVAGSNWSLKRMILWALTALAVGGLFQLTRHVYRLTDMRDALRLAAATLALAAVSLVMKVMAGPLSLYPLMPNIAFGAAILTGVFWGALRIGCRWWRETHAQPAAIPAPAEQRRNRTLIVGAGKAGALVLQELERHPELGYDVIGFVDDDATIHGDRAHGVRVLGGSDRLEAIVRKHNVTHAVLAIPSASGLVVRKLNAALQGLRVQIKTVPGLYNLLGTQVWKPVIRDVSIEDVLRRDPVRLNHSAMLQAVEGSVVLITGAGGSIGSELARQICNFKPKHLVLLGRGENSLWMIQQEIQRLFPTQPYSLELMDIRKRSGLRELFQIYRPDIVLHAAAHKHVPFLETHPAEAVLNNIFGTKNVVEAALESGVRSLVSISTDKAVNPTNVLGASKRIAECIVLEASKKAQPGKSFVSVRFGNVLGSRGSVVPIFVEQIERGGPITVTHPEMTRYFMTIPEASQLVLQAGLLGGTGKVYVLDMGEPVKIADLAADMVKLSGLTPGRDIEIRYTGLRPGEKLHEELFLDSERSSTTLHAKVFETNPHGIPPDKLQEGMEAFRKAITLPFRQRQPEIVRLLKWMVPTYTPSLLGVGRYGGHAWNRRKVNSSVPPEECRRKNPPSKDATAPWLVANKARIQIKDDTASRSIYSLEPWATPDEHDA
ncbi:nucleoside-diphosphate sugar epimerase/dehydratase [Geothrix sp. PMB-07]|uniref:polysaccharide biosynthesis protein n=1 Tax=Geothrix sp. PMB-07 TaxID=3068640 RepID=UPI00274035E7|nr:nucleoside-diphosphate sugar epimerase/dehydratase [Geothrix sp. PMB-07]WLT30203.1 nucleoside-diphosphate sugar epimerase/dehydratase [Geothrix sp. PMB-07]